MEYHCHDCGMGVTGMRCSECDQELVHDTVKTEQGKTVQVSKCPKGCGMIKSPQCCGQDMQVCEHHP